MTDTPDVDTQKPVATIRPPSGWSSFDVGELWRYRGLLRTLAIRDLKVRYKQTALGVVWVVFQPFAAAGIFSFVFGAVANFEAPGGVPYFLFTFAGLQAWNVFAQTALKATNSLVSNSHLVQKIYFPRLLMPLSSLATTLVDFGVVMVALAALVVVFWTPPGLTILLLPVPLAILMMIALGLGLTATAISVRYRDIQFVLPVLVQLALYASPVAYAVAEVPERYRSLYLLNPVAAPLEAFRYAVFGTGDPRPGYLAYSAAVASLILMVGVLIFKRLERGFADVI